jgi:hypothetical protein
MIIYQVSSLKFAVAVVFLYLGNVCINAYIVIYIFVKVVQNSISVLEPVKFTEVYK